MLMYKKESSKHIAASRYRSPHPGQSRTPSVHPPTPTHIPPRSLPVCKPTRFEGISYCSYQLIFLLDT